MKKILFTALYSAVLICAIAQAPVRRLPTIINHPSLNLIAPYISADGNALVFVSDAGQDGALIVSYASRETEWTTPVELPKHINNRLNFFKGFSLSSDGKTLYVTSAKSPVIGGYDIMVSELTGNTWSAPVNLMLPINSRLHDGCPSVTPDASAIYFMRCDRMDQNRAEGCRLFSSVKKPNGQWSEPVELPSSINTGNSQTPRIMADGQTLIFSSDQIKPNKGGMDLYMSRLQNGSWSAPVALDFANTERDDQYVSVSAIGRYLLKEAKGQRNNYELTEFLFPPSLRPRGLTKVEGKVNNAATVPSYITVTDLQTSSKFYTGRPASDGSFSLYLPEGTTYELSVDPEQGDYTYFSKYFDLTTDKIPQREKVNVTLSRLKRSDEIPLDLVGFQPLSAEIDKVGQRELKRFARLAKGSGDLNFEIRLTLRGVMTDSVKSSPELTEVKVDTVLVEPPVPLDSAGYEIPPTRVAVTTFHNDRTLRQAEAIHTFLLNEGVHAEQISFVVNAIESTEPPYVEVKAVVR